MLNLRPVCSFQFLITALVMDACLEPYMTDSKVACSEQHFSLFACAEQRTGLVVTPASVVSRGAKSTSFSVLPGGKSELHRSPCTADQFLANVASGVTASMHCAHFTSSQSCRLANLLVSEWVTWNGGMSRLLNDRFT